MNRCLSRPHLSHRTTPRRVRQSLAVAPRIQDLVPFHLHIAEFYLWMKRRNLRAEFSTHFASRWNLGLSQLRVLQVQPDIQRDFC
jgi:hypothetical protein